MLNPNRISSVELQKRLPWLAIVEKEDKPDSASTATTEAQTTAA